jgi:hypothetical protein
MIDLFLKAAKLVGAERSQRWIDRHYACSFRQKRTVSVSSFLRDFYLTSFLAG